MTFTKTQIRKRVKEARWKKKLKKWVEPWTPEEEQFYMMMIEETKQAAYDRENQHIENVEKAAWEHIVSPLYLTIKKKTLEWQKKPINLNDYRNRDFRLSNDLKIQYKKLMKDQIKDIKCSWPIWITYTLYYNSTASDLMNFGSIIDKFFCDMLQEEWCLVDDNVVNYIESHYVVWWQDKKNPRMEITII